MYATIQALLQAAIAALSQNPQSAKDFARIAFELAHASSNAHLIRLTIASFSDAGIQI